MSNWADDFFVVGQRAWATNTEAVLGVWPAMGSRAEGAAMGASSFAIKAKTALARRNGG
jgi:hypothetical protein